MDLHRESTPRGTVGGKEMASEERMAGFDRFSCEGYQYTRPVCSHFEGVIQSISDWAFGKNAYLARETLCMAKGDKTCYVKLVKKE
jgi:predicted hydrocarbon binding protein